MRYINSKRITQKFLALKMRLLGKKFIPGFRIEPNDNDEYDEQLISPTANGGINIAQVEIEDSEVQQNLSNAEPLAVNEPTEQAVVRSVR